MSRQAALSTPMILFLSALVTQTATAQTSQTSPTLEEVVVTAEKRAESVQDVPITISAFSADDIGKLGVASTRDLGVVTPGLQMGQQVGASTPYLRGIGGQNSSVGDEASVSTYVDGIYLPGLINSVQGFNNIERVEVLKGPQGTLFGRNTTGGVIHIITKDPTPENQLRMRVHAGRFDTYGGDFYGSLGIGENLALDLSIAAQRQEEGWGTNVALMEEIGFDEYTQVRTKLLYQPTDRTTVRLSLSWDESDTDLALTRNCLPNTVCAGTPALNGDFHDINTGIRPEISNQAWLFSAQIEHSMSNFDLFSITSYKDGESDQSWAQNNTPPILIAVRAPQSIDTFSQEIRLHSNDQNTAYSWIVGGFYWSDSSAYERFSLAGPLIAGSLSRAGLPGDSITFDPDVETESFAVFGQGTYDLSDSTTLTLGARWTSDERSISGGATLGTLVATSYDEEKTFDEPTWRLAIEHNWSDNVLLFAAYNRGFKSGVFNTVVSSGTPQPPIDPEIVDAFEVGLKGDFLDNRLRFNISGFVYQYENIQISRIEGGVSILQNAAEGDVKGIEVEGEAVVTDNLRLRYGYSFLDASYEDFPDCVIFAPIPGSPGFGAPTPTDCTGNDMVRSPDSLAYISAMHEYPTDVGVFSTSVTASHNSGFFWDPSNLLEESSYTVVNAELAWTSMNDKYRLRLYGRNLLDEEYSLFTNLSSIGNTYGASPPLTFGVSAEISIY